MVSNKQDVSVIVLTEIENQQKKIDFLTSIEFCER